MESEPANGKAYRVVDLTGGVYRGASSVGAVDDLEVSLLWSVAEEIREAIETHGVPDPPDLAEILDLCCLPLLREPEVLSVLVMLMGEAAVRPSRLATNVAGLRRRALAHVAERIAASQRRGLIPADVTAETVARVAGTVLTGLCLTAFAEGRQPTLGEYWSVREFLVSAFV